MTFFPVPSAHLASGSSASWTFDSLLIAAVVAAGVAYDVGVRRLRGRKGRATRTPKWRALCFGAGLMAMLVALLSPLDALSADVLSAHMGQHLILVVVAAPLLVLGAPAVPILLALPVRWRRRVHRLGSLFALRSIRKTFTQPLAVWVLHVVALWSWHVPALYDAAVRNDALHALEHATFLGTAFLFWWVLLDPAGRRRLAPGHDILYVFTAGAQSAALGALLTFASSPLYRIYVERAPLHGVSPLHDQQLAGLVMWIPAGVVYLVAAAVLFVRWLRSVEEESRRQERTTAVPVEVGT
jgi:putative membrane protein